MRGVLLRWRKYERHYLPAIRSEIETLQLAQKVIAALHKSTPVASFIHDSAGLRANDQADEIVAAIGRHGFVSTRELEEKGQTIPIGVPLYIPEIGILSLPATILGTLAMSCSNGIGALGLVRSSGATPLALFKPRLRK